MKLFEELSQLKIIRDIGSDSHVRSRIEYLELVKNKPKEQQDIVKNTPIKAGKWLKLLSLIRRS